MYASQGYNRQFAAAILKRVILVAMYLYTLCYNRQPYWSQMATSHVTHYVISSVVQKVFKDQTVFGECQAIQSAKKSIIAFGCNSNHCAHCMESDL